MAHRYSDFETLHKALLTENPQLQLPPLPPKVGRKKGEVVVVGRLVVGVFLCLDAMRVFFLAWKQYGRK